MEKTVDKQPLALLRRFGDTEKRYYLFIRLKHLSSVQIFQNKNVLEARNCFVSVFRNPLSFSYMRFNISQVPKLLQQIIILL